MFGSITVFQVTGGMPESAQILADALKDSPFAPTGPTQEKSIGWVPPREENGALVEAVNGQWIAEVTTESRAVPGSAIKDLAEARAKEIEEKTGRKPGKKEMRSIKEECLQELLPKAFPKRSSTVVWFNPSKGWLVMGTTSSSKTDEIITQLVRLLPQFSCARLNTNSSPSTAMTRWLSEKEIPGALDFGTSLELKAMDDSRATAKFGSHYLLCDEVCRHLQMGKTPTKMGLSWDGKVDFSLDGEMRISKLKFNIEKEPSDEAADFFDGTVAIETGELEKMITELIETLGGAMPFGTAAEAQSNESKGSGAAAASADAAEHAFIITAADASIAKGHEVLARVREMGRGIPEMSEAGAQD